MCGIFAWVGPGLAADELRAATDVMVHRGPDSSGYWNDELCFLGHRRLRIIDLSELGAQPMPNEDGQIQVSFNGEIYNFPELKSELLARGHVFRGKSDTEVIVHGYEEWGDEVVGKLWGMFAFALWDRRKRRMLVARDRFGKKPVNYVHKVERLALASEIPAVLATGLSDRRVDLAALSCFWQSDAFIPAPMTGFADVKKLPAGCYMTFEGGRLDIRRYYPPAAVEPFKGSYDDAKAQLRDLLADATARRLVSDVPVGIALSGGIDSAIVVAAARRIAQGRLITVTVRPHTDGSSHDEGEFARATAERYGTEHIEIRPVPDFRESFETVIRNIGEPFATASAVPTYYLFKALREHVTVVLAGDGGDENFCGYSHYWDMGKYAALKSVTPGFVARAMYGMFNGVYGAVPASRGKLKQVLAGLQVLQDRPFTDARWEYAKLLTGRAFEGMLRTDVILGGQAELMKLTNEAEPMRRQMVAEMFGRMTYHIMTKVDICSMAHTVESRSPLLDHRIAEFARSLPTEFMLGQGFGKKILRDLFADELPKSVLEKPKSGFGIDVRAMFAGPLRGYVTEVLTSPHPTYDALVHRGAIPGLLESHAAGRPFHTQLLMKLLALRLWIGNTNPVL
jgi:asparagine synthase (glutamine-hydrolysing)